MKKVLILEADKDQAITFISFLKKHFKCEFTLEYDVDYKGNNSFDIIIPAGATSTLKYIEKNNTLKIGELIYTQDNLITFDKIKMLNLVESIGVPIPKTYTEKSELNFFPVFFKSLREEGYNERGIIKNKQDLDALHSKTVFYQEFINTQGTYAVGFLADKGKVLTTFIQDEKVSYPRHGGSGVVLENIEDKKLLDYTNRICKATNYSGWGLVEFKYCDIRDDYVFMEVNGKFWASIEFAFINNPVFVKKLFGIELKSKNIKSVVYIDRLLISNWSEIKKTLPYLLKSKWIRKRSVLKLILSRFK